MNFIAGSNTMVYLLRLVTVSDNMSKYITKHIAGVSIQILYHDIVVALTQVNIEMYILHFGLQCNGALVIHLKITTVFLCVFCMLFSTFSLF